jgi:hypothetical protein
MTTAKNIKSGRKKFQVMRIKTNLMSSMGLSDDEANARYDEIEKSLLKTFTQSQTDEILLEAVEAADIAFSDRMSDLAKAKASSVEMKDKEE